MKSFSKLYVAQTLIFLALAIACFSVDLSFSTNVCGATDTESASFKQKMSSLIKKGLAYMYLICAGLSFVVAALSIYFGNGYLPPDLGKLSRVISILGVI
jgi:hypothetical protein